jgi:Delta14-sterol reductase
MAVARKGTAELNPKTHGYEFFGPPGALFVTISVPLTTYALYYSCSETSGGCPPPLSVLPSRFLNAVEDPKFWTSLWDTKAAIIYFSWYAFCVVAWAILPGDWIEGVTMRTGEKKKYKINGPSPPDFFTS